MAKPVWGLKYRSDEVYRCMEMLFRDPGKNQRRVVAVAYVGDDAPSLLPDPAGIEIICSPTAGATSASAIGKLNEKGALVSFAERLHMKVYWSEGRGCLVTSANLTRNAMGRGGLHEAGVLLSDRDVPIDKILTSIGKLTPARGSALTKLERETRAHDAARSIVSTGRTPQRTYPEWYSEHKAGGTVADTLWKLGWWQIDKLGPCKEARARAPARANGAKEPFDCFNVQRNQVQRYDWILTFKLAKKLVDFDWRMAEDVLRVSPKDKRAYEKEYPFQVVQYRPNRLCPTPPFQADKSFRDAFNRASIELYNSHDWMMDLLDLSPPSLLLDKVYEHYN